MTADALFTQRPLARLILEADRDFLFVLKDNQPDVLDAVTLRFAEAAATAPDAKTVEKGGADPYTKALDRQVGTADYVRQRCDFPGVRMVFRLDYEVRERGQQVSLETRYGLTSLSPEQVSPKQLMGWVRGHWGVEIPQSDDPRSDNLCVAGRAGYHRRGGPARVGRVVRPTSTTTEAISCSPTNRPASPPPRLRRRTH